jgi:RNA polymerase sigma-70 factor, ECF subfamily
MPHTDSPSFPSDEELVRQAQEGCQASFVEIMRRYQVPVLHFLKRRGSGADAEDLLQDTFLRVYANLQRYRRRWRVATWVFTIARRVSINHHRRTQLVTAVQALPHVVSAAKGPVQTVVEEENRQYLWHAAAQALSEEEMTAIWLYYVEDLSVREVAVVLGRSWVAVKTMMFRARQKLLPLLREIEPEGPRRYAGQRGDGRTMCIPVSLEVPDV